MTPAIQIRLIRPDEGIEEALAALARFASGLQIPPSTINDLSVAVDEIITNIVEHGKLQEAPGVIDIRFGTGDGTIAIEIEDNCAAFNPVANTPTPKAIGLRDRPIGGLGLVFVKQVMDEVRYNYTGKRNHLTLIKRLRGAGAKQGPAAGDNMQINRGDSGDVKVVEPVGAIDSRNAKMFTDYLTKLAEGASPRVVIDFKQVAYISSAGFRSLLIAGKALDGAEGKLVLCGMSPEIKRLFEISEFDELFAICATRDEAKQKAG